MVREITLPDFKAYYIIGVIKTVWYWQNTHHWNGGASPEIVPHKNRPLTKDKMQFNEERTVFSESDAGTIDQPQATTVELNTNHTCYTKFDPKWVTDLKINCKTINLLEMAQEKNLQNLELSEEFLDITSKA